MQVQMIKVADLQLHTRSPFDYVDPMYFTETQNIWESNQKMTFEHVKYCCLLSEEYPVNPEAFNAYHKDPEYVHSYDHIGRIKWFCTKETNFLWEPIDLDVGVPELGFIPENIIQDGWHRFAAALIMDHDSIAATYSGSKERFEELFDYDEPSEPLGAEPCTPQELKWVGRRAMVTSIKAKSGKIHKKLIKFIGCECSIFREAKNSMLIVGFYKNANGSNFTNRAFKEVAIPASCLTEITFNN